MMRFCSLQSGSSGNCQYIAYKDTKILVDAGLNGKQTAIRLAQIGVDITEIDGILLTHEHSDHIAGAGVLARRHKIPVYARERTHLAAHPIIKDLGHGLRQVHGEDFFLKDLYIQSFPVSHDAVDPVGFAIYGGDKKISIITDTGFVPQEALEKTKESNLYFIESNHDKEMLWKGPYPMELKLRIAGAEGHLSNEDAGRYVLQQLQTGKEIVVLGHLSSDNNTEERAYETVETMLKEGRKECRLSLSHRHEHGEVFDL